jgi:hypothetical protein
MIIEGTSQTIVRPLPETDVVVSAFACRADGEVDRLVRVTGFESRDYLTGAEACALAGALTAAAAELSGVTRSNT